MTKRGSWLMGVALAGLAVCVAPAQAGPNLLNNGGFETGDFTGWTGTGDTTFNGVQCPGPGATVFQGNCSAFFGPVGTTGGISQSVNLGTPLVPVHILFWVLFDGGNPSSFNATFGGVALDAFPLNNPAAGPTLYHFGLLASGSQTLAFSFRDDPGFIFLDGVEVRIPEPATIALLGAALAGLGFSRRRKAA
jgi:hypothetical protein